MDICRRLFYGPEIVIRVRPDVPQLTRAGLFSRLAELSRGFREQGNLTPSGPEIMSSLYKTEGTQNALFYALDDSNHFQDLCATAMKAAAAPESTAVDVIAALEAVWEYYEPRKLPEPKP